MSGLVSVRHGDEHHLTLCRPEEANAFDAEGLSALTAAFRGPARAPGVRAVILRGEGRHFCAGASLTWMKEARNASPEENLRDAGRLYEMYDAMVTCPVPIVVVAQGKVFGGGVGLCAAADVVLAHREAQFCVSEVRVGLAPVVMSPFMIEKLGVGGLGQKILQAKTQSDRIAGGARLGRLVRDA